MALLLVGLIHGGLWLVVMPPWQHYDEPGHFEYAWLAANRANWPQRGDYDAEMRHQVFESMLANDFYTNIPLPDLTQTPIYTGIPQIGDQPVYYWLAAVPLRGLAQAPIETQLYASRLVSLSLYLVMLLAAWNALGEVFPHGKSALRWKVPFSLALLPGLADLMTAVNNDVAAIAFSTVFFWSALRLLRRGLSLPNVVFSLGAVLLCLFSKSTAWVVAPLWVISMWLAALGAQRRVLAWGSLALVGLAASMVILTVSGAALWLPNRSASVENRLKTSRAIAGEYAFRLPTLSQGLTASINQRIPGGLANSLTTRHLTLGGWAWSDLPARLVVEVHARSQRIYQGVFETDGTARFFAAGFDVPEGQTPTLVRVFAQANQADRQVWLDGLVLAEGAYPLHSAPEYTDAEASAGTWGGEPWSNLVRNASAEQPSLHLRAWVYPLDRDVMYSSLSMALFSWQDPDSTGWYFRAAGAYLFRTFWGRFGWGHVPLLGAHPYRVLLGLTLFAALGWLIWLVRRRQHPSQPQTGGNLLGILVLAVLITWGIALLRGAASVFSPNLFIPSARYALPGVLPSMILLSIGWQAGVNWIPVKAPRRLISSLYLLAWIGFAGYALVSAYIYYHG